MILQATHLPTIFMFNGLSALLLRHGWTVRNIKTDKNMPPLLLYIFPNGQYSEHYTTLSSGDVLHGTRYRLLKQLNILSRQQGQKAAWLASDAQSAGRRVILRPIAFPQSTPADQQKILQTISQA